MATQEQLNMISHEHLRAVFKPKGIAVVGATERPGSVGRTTLENLMKGYGFTGKPNPFEVYPVNPTRDNVLGLKCYKAVSDIDTGKCESVLIITPANRCIDVVRDCTKNKSVKVVIVIAAGFKEVGPEGLKLELELVEAASKAGIAVIGPNCLGVMSPNWQLNATFAADSALPGSIGFVSQSGAMCCAVLDWALQMRQGFSAFVSIGSMAHIEWSHLLKYLGDDEQTKVIIIYMEAIGSASRFLSAARQVAAKKPIVVIKAGKTAAAAAAAVSHTGSLAGSHDAFVAAMKRAGVLVVDTIDELQNIAVLSSLQPQPTGSGLYIVTNAGGPGVIATDAADIAGLEVLHLEDDMVERMSTFLPPAWSHANPIDVLGDAKADVYGKCVEEVLLHGKKGSALLVVLSPQSVTEPDRTAEAVIKAVKDQRGKGEFDGPVLCAFMGGDQVQAARIKLVEGGIPSFSQPDAAANALNLAHRQREGAKALTPIPSSTNAVAKRKAQEAMAAAVKDGRTILTESESKTVLKAYGVDVAESIVCQSRDEAVAAAKQVRYPCVIKLNSESITHKSDVGGVKLNIKTDEEVRKAWDDIKANVDAIGPDHFQGVSVQPMLDLAAGVEILVGSSSDLQFGPMVLFGAGGCFVEVFRDVKMAVPPLGAEDAQGLIDSTNISKALRPGHGARFKGCPMDDLVKTVEKFSVAVCDLYEDVAEMEINPLLALPDRIIALDARVVLRKKDSESKPAQPCLL